MFGWFFQRFVEYSAEPKYITLITQPKINAEVIYQPFIKWRLLNKKGIDYLSKSAPNNKKKPVLQSQKIAKYILLKPPG